VPPPPAAHVWKDENGNVQGERWWERGDAVGVDGAGTVGVEGRRKEENIGTMGAPPGYDARESWWSWVRGMLMV
jgi:hypothetical protein